MSTYESDDHESIDNRTVRALTEYLTVLPDYGRARGADGLYMVVSESGEEYLVDGVTGACRCPDAEHRDPEGGCKHVRRVAFATGEEAIPGEVDDVDPQLGDHVAGEPITAEARADEAAVATDGGSEIIEADDGGVILDDGDDTDDSTERPDDCECRRFDTEGVDLPCWACYREGFETVADGAEILDDSEEEAGRSPPTRSEPADFGGGETTGVQDL